MVDRSFSAVNGRYLRVDAQLDAAFSIAWTLIGYHPRFGGIGFQLPVFGNSPIFGDAFFSRSSERIAHSCSPS